MKPLGFMSGSTGSSSDLKRLKWQGHGLMPHPKDWESRGLNLGPLGTRHVVQLQHHGGSETVP